MISPEVLTNVGVIGAAILAVLAGHYSKRVFGDPPVPPAVQGAPPPNAVLAGIGIELATRTHYEQLVAVQTRIAIALEVLADRKLSDMAEMHAELMSRLDEAEMSAKAPVEPKPKRAPRRRPKPT